MGFCEFSDAFEPDYLTEFDARAKLPTMNDYFATLTEVRVEIDRRLQKAAAVLVDLGYFSMSHQAFSDGVPYGQVVQAHCELVLLKGKPTRKWAHAVVERMETGRYELTFYIL